MLTALRQGRVVGLRIMVACSTSLEEMPHDAYLLDLAPANPTAGGGRFDEVPYLECLEPVLDAAGGPPSWVVDVSRTHRSDRDGVGQAHVSVLLATGKTPTVSGPQLTDVVRSAFSRMTQLPAPPASSAALGHAEAIAAATAAVAEAFPHMDTGALSLTDEEHHAAEQRWSLGLALEGLTRFQVLLGLVPGVPASAHVHRAPMGEVVDSVGA